MNHPIQMTPEMKRKQEVRCWSGDGCNRTAIIENQSGYRYCLKHYFWFKKHDPSIFNNFRKFIWSNIFKL